MRLIFIFLFSLLMSNTNAKGYPIDEFPIQADQDCRGGKAKIFDECSDQNLVLNQAISAAKTSGKSVLVTYGSEWCIWCHVFDKYIHGRSRKHEYEWLYDDQLQQWTMTENENPNAEKEAAALNKYVSANFVIANIEGDYSPNGRDVINQTDYDASQIKHIPFIMVLGRGGKYAGHMEAYSAIEGLEIRKDSGEDYRGFNRIILLNELKKLKRLSASQ